MDVDGIEFAFPDGWRAIKWDGTAFHTHFQNIGGGSKSCDIVALPPEGDELWLIEVKDYRRHARQKEIDLCHEVARKARDTLAALWAAQRNANAEAEVETARLARRRKSIRIVLYLEQPPARKRLSPREKSSADLKFRLKQVAKAIDPHPVVSSIDVPGAVHWTAS